MADNYERNSAIVACKFKAHSETKTRGATSGADVVQCTDLVYLVTDVALVGCH